MPRQNRRPSRLQNRQHAGERELFPGSLRLTRSAATAYDRARYRWSIGAERWRTRRDEQELRAQGSLIHLDLRLSFTVLALWAFTAAALTVGTWRVVHPLACVLIALLGCLAILLFFPPRAVMPYSLLFRTTGQLVFLACIVTVQAVLLCATGVDASRATLQQAQGASLRLNGTVEQVRRVDPRTTLVVIKLEEIQGRSVRALVNERVRVYRRDGSAKSAAQRLEASSAPGERYRALAGDLSGHEGDRPRHGGVQRFHGEAERRNYFSRARLRCRIERYRPDGGGAVPVHAQGAVAYPRPGHPRHGVGGAGFGHRLRG